MPRLIPISGKEMCKLVEKLGFVFDRQKGSHRVYKHPDGRKTVVPIHGNEDIILPLLNDIIKQIKLSREEYEKLRKEV